MKNGFTTLAKLFAICFTFALLGGYVWWRVDRAKQEETRMLAEQKAAAALVKRLAEDEGIEVGELQAIPSELLMSSSKSGLLMPSSKSGPAINFEEVLKNNPELRKQLEESAQEAEEQMPKEEDGPVSPSKERVVMPSSKSIDSILIPRDTKSK